MFIDGTATVALTRVTDVMPRVICATTGWRQQVMGTDETFKHSYFNYNGPNLFKSNGSIFTI